MSDRGGWGCGRDRVWRELLSGVRRVQLSGQDPAMHP